MLFWFSCHIFLTGKFWIGAYSDNTDGINVSLLWQVIYFPTFYFLSFAFLSSFTLLSLTLFSLSCFKTQSLIYMFSYSHQSINTDRNMYKCQLSVLRGNQRNPFKEFLCSNYSSLITKIIRIRLSTQKLNKGTEIAKFN